MPSPLRFGSAVAVLDQASISSASTRNRLAAAGGAGAGQQLHRLRAQGVSAVAKALVDTNRHNL